MMIYIYLESLGLEILLDSVYLSCQAPLMSYLPYVRTSTNYG